MKKTTMLTGWLFIICLFIRVGANAQENNDTRGDIPTRLDSLFTTLANNNEFNGNVLAAADGKIIYQHSFGYADAERQQLNTSQTAFNLASVSKVFTAVAILQLKQRGKLGLDDHYVKYFQDFPWPEDHFTSTVVAYFRPG